MPGPLDPRSPLSDPAQELGSEDLRSLEEGRIKLERPTPEMPGAVLQMGTGAVPFGASALKQPLSRRERMASLEKQAQAAHEAYMEALAPHNYDGDAVFRDPKALQAAQKLQQIQDAYRQLFVDHSAELINREVGDKYFVQRQDHTYSAPQEYTDAGLLSHDRYLNLYRKSDGALVRAIRVFDEPSLNEMVQKLKSEPVQSSVYEEAQRRALEAAGGIAPEGTVSLAAKRFGEPYKALDDLTRAKSGDVVPFVGGAKPSSASISDQIKQAYFNLTDNAVNQRVPLTDIRGQLKHLPTEAVDAELQRMHMDPSESHTLAGEDNPKAVDDILRRGMINFKGEPKYYLWITKR